MRGLAKAIGVDAGQLARESKRPGFPSIDTPKGKSYDPEEVIRWRKTNLVRKNSKRRAVSDAPQPAPVAPAPQWNARATVSGHWNHVDRPPADDPEMPVEEPDDTDLLAILTSPKSTALEISHAAMQLASRRMAWAHVRRVVGPNDFEGLKKALQELRSAEADYSELKKNLRELIARDEVRLMIGEAYSRMVQVMDKFGNLIAGEVPIWFTDSKFAGMSVDEQRRFVRAFVKEKSSEIRAQEADEIEQLIDRKPDDDAHR